MNGYCDSWDCNMQTVDDVKKEAINEYIKAVVKELEKIEQHCLDMSDWQGQSAICDAIEIVKAGRENE